MAKKPKKPQPLTRIEKILLRTRVAIGTYPGQNRARTFKDRKKDANKKACRKGNW